MKLNIKPLKQGDSRWATRKLPGGGTMKDIGCLVTCLSMTLSKLPTDLLNKDIFKGNRVE